MCKHGPQTPHRVGRLGGLGAHDDTIMKRRPNEIWTTGASSASASSIQVRQSVRCSQAGPGRRSTTTRWVRSGHRLGNPVQARAGDVAPARHLLKRAGVSGYQEIIVALVWEFTGKGCAERFIRILKEIPAVGADLHHRGGVPTGAPSVQGPIQSRVDPWAPQLPGPEKGQ